MAKTTNSKLNRIWKFFNKPLIVAAIVTSIAILFAFAYGQKEKVRCNFILHPNIDYIKNKWNYSDDVVNSFLRLYSKPFIANLTFDNYQEALAFKQLSIDGQNHEEWYKPTLDCNEAKMGIPLNFRDIINK